jgi:hypothetical protein
VARGSIEDGRTGWVYRSGPPVVTAARPRPEYGWLERGLLVMAVPVALTLTAMLLPALWMFGPRTER